MRLYQNICIDLGSGREREAYNLDFEFESEETFCQWLLRKLFIIDVKQYVGWHSGAVVSTAASQQQGAEIK